MKTLMWAGAAAVLFSAGAGAGIYLAPDTPGLLQSQRMTQMAVVVHDIEKSAQAWAALFGVAAPRWSLTETQKRAKTEFRGAPTNAQAKLAFLRLENLTIELIEPVGTPSTWREFLDSHGEAVHHIAFDVEGMDQVIAGFDKAGMPLAQRGRWTGGRGGQYAYIDAAQKLGVMLELLESN